MMRDLSLWERVPRRPAGGNKYNPEAPAVLITDLSNSRKGVVVWYIRIKVSVKGISSLIIT